LSSATSTLPDVLTANRLLRPEEAAEYLGLSLATIYTKACRRQLPFVKVGRCLRFRVRDLDRFTRQGECPALSLEAPGPVAA
jgi:excisionase family DNA binding protein